MGDGPTKQELAALLPWWSKLVHRALVAAADAASANEDSDERRYLAIASGAQSDRLRPTIDDDAGLRACRIEAASIRAR
jgi:hypothetical protein